MKFVKTSDALVLIDQHRRKDNKPLSYPEFPGYLLRDQRTGDSYGVDELTFTLLKNFIHPLSLEDIDDIVDALSANQYPKEEVRQRLVQLQRDELLTQVGLPHLEKTARMMVADGRAVMRGVPLAPETVIWNITDRCNLSCIHCITKEISTEESPCKELAAVELTYGESLELLSAIDALGVQELQISGGEPFLREDINDLLMATLDKSFKVTVFTNGVSLSEENIEVCEAILRVKPWGLQFHISLDGAAAESHDYLRGAGAFQRTLNTLEQLRSAHIAPTAIECMATQRNLSELEDLIKLCLDFQVKYLHIHPIYSFRQFSGSGGIEPDFDLDLSTRKQFFERCQALARQYSDVIRLIYTDPYFPLGVLYAEVYQSHREQVAKAFLEQLVSRSRHAENTGHVEVLLNESADLDKKHFRLVQLENCSAGLKRMFIAPNGDVYPCLLYRGSSPDYCGNVRKHRLAHIWTSGGMARARTPLTRERLTECAGCNQYAQCGNKPKNCRIAAELALNDYFGPSPYCRKYQEELGIQISKKGGEKDD